MRLVILAAGTGSRLSPLTDDRPKCMVELCGRPLLEWTLDAVEKTSIDEVIVVGGYRAEQLAKYDVTLVVNEHYATTNMVHSLTLAKEFFDAGFVMSYGDIAYSADTLQALIDVPDGVSVAVDKDWRPYWELRFGDPLDDAETLRLAADGRLSEIGNVPSSYEDIEGQYIGLATFKGTGVHALERAIEHAQADQAAGRHPFNCPRSFSGLYMTDLLQGMIGLGDQVMAVPIHGSWVEIDTPRDLAVAQELLAQGRLASHEGD